MDTNAAHDMLPTSDDALFNVMVQTAALQALDRLRTTGDMDDDDEDMSVIDTTHPSYRGLTAEIKAACRDMLLVNSRWEKILRENQRGIIKRAKSKAREISGLLNYDNTIYNVVVTQLPQQLTSMLTVGGATILNDKLYLCDWRHGYNNNNTVEVFTLLVNTTNPTGVTVHLQYDRGAQLLMPRAEDFCWNRKWCFVGCPINGQLYYVETYAHRDSGGNDFIGAFPLQHQIMKVNASTLKLDIQFGGLFLPLMNPNLVRCAFLLDITGDGEFLICGYMECFTLESDAMKGYVHDTKNARNQRSCVAIFNPLNGSPLRFLEDAYNIFDETRMACGYYSDAIFYHSSFEANGVEEALTLKSRRESYTPMAIKDHLLSTTLARTALFQAQKTIILWRQLQYGYKPRDILESRCDTKTNATLVGKALESISPPRQLRIVNNRVKNFLRISDAPTERNLFVQIKERDDIIRVVDPYAGLTRCIESSTPPVDVGLNITLCVCTDTSRNFILRVYRHALGDILRVMISGLTRTLEDQGLNIQPLDTEGIPPNP